MCVLAGDGMFTQNENISTVAAFLPPVERRGRIEKMLGKIIFRTHKKKQEIFLSFMFLFIVVMFVCGRMGQNS